MHAGPMLLLSYVILSATQWSRRISQLPDCPALQGCFGCALLLFYLISMPLQIRMIFYRQVFNAFPAGNANFIIGAGAQRGGG